MFLPCTPSCCKVDGRLPTWRPIAEAWKWDGGQHWTRWETNGVPAFAHHAMGFDSKRGVLVIVGRVPGRKVWGDYQTWEYDGFRWARKANVPISKSAQGDAKLSYDVERGKMVLYAALTKGTAETWEHDGKRWRKIKSVHAPVKCDDGALLQCDQSIHKTILIGESYTGKDILAWDGHQWGYSGGTGTQTWLWDGTDWTQLHGEQPAEAVWGGLAFSKAQQRMILLSTTMETWMLGEKGWQILHPVHSPYPSPNGFFAMAYDPVAQSIIFFGGENRKGRSESEWAYPETTWIYDGND